MRYVVDCTAHAHSLAAQSKAHALEISRMQGRATRSPPGAERSDGPALPPLEAAPARAMTVAEPVQCSMQWHRVLTRGSCPNGARSEFCRAAAVVSLPAARARLQKSALGGLRRGSSLQGHSLAAAERLAAPPKPLCLPLAPRRRTGSRPRRFARNGAQRSGAQCRVADVGPLFFAYFLWRGKESKCAAGRISRPLRQCQSTKPGYGAQRQDAGRKTPTANHTAKPPATHHAATHTQAPPHARPKGTPATSKKIATPE